MGLYRPSELIHLLTTLCTHAKKSLSQNFLIDGNIIAKTIAVAEVSSDDIVLEIGPGPGALTEALLNTDCSVIAIEKDETFASHLVKQQKATVFCDDILTFPIEDTLNEYLPHGKKTKVVANIPYSLTSPLLARLVPLNHLFSTITIMVQEEVARRCVAQPGSRDYSSLTVFLNYYSQPRYEFKVKKTCFYPVPKVNSAVISLQLTKRDEIDAPEKFFQLVRQAFQQRRKTIRSSLRSLFLPNRIAECLTDLNHSPHARPEELSIDDFIALYRIMKLS